MTTRIAALCGAIAMAGLTVTAQTPPSPEKRGASADTITVTGCLSTRSAMMSARPSANAPAKASGGPMRTEASTAYVLTGVTHEAGTSSADEVVVDTHRTAFALHTTDASPDLSMHLDHKVALTGTLEKAGPQGPQAASAGTTGETGTGTPGRGAAMRMAMPTLTVTGLTMVSATCK